jgi:hypothetical protein
MLMYPEERINLVLKPFFTFLRTTWAEIWSWQPTPLAALSPEQEAIHGVIPSFLFDLLCLTLHYLTYNETKVSEVLSSNTPCPLTRRSFQFIIHNHNYHLTLWNKYNSYRVFLKRRYSFNYIQLPNYIANITVFGVSEFSSLGRMCCSWWQCHEAAVIKMDYTI